MACTCPLCTLEEAMKADRHQAFVMILTIQLIQMNELWKLTNTGEISTRHFPRSMS